MSDHELPPEPGGTIGAPTGDGLPETMEDFWNAIPSIAYGYAKGQLGEAYAKYHAGADDVPWTLGKVESAFRDLKNNNERESVRIPLRDMVEMLSLVFMEGARVGRNLVINAYNRPVADAEEEEEAQ